MINPVLRGWTAYYGRFYHSALAPLLYRVNTYLLRWIRKKYRVGWKEARRRMALDYTRSPRAFAHGIWAAPTGTMARTTRAV
jgi:RNA-directed DNA polymerase